MKAKYPYLIVGITLLAFCLLSFPQFFKNGFDGSFNNITDGLKNNYTLLRFVTEPIGPKGIFYFDFFQYPYGDYVYTTDNTPLYSLVMRWIHHYVTPIDACIIPGFNSIMISNIITCGLLLYYLCARILPSKAWATGLAIILPVTLEQLLRLPKGIGNLSLSSLFVFSFILCYWYTQSAHSRKKSLLLLLSMFLTNLFGFLIHGYYLPILCIIFFTFLLIHHIKSLDIPVKPLPLLRPFLLITLIGLSAFWLMQATDGYFSIRQKFAQGYDAGDQKLALSYLYQSFPFSSINFPVRVNTYGSFAEPHMYMGHAFWALLFLTVIIALFNTLFRRKLFRAFYTLAKDKYLAPVAVVLFFSLVTSLGKSLYNQGIILSPAPLFNIEGAPLYFIHYFAISMLLLAGLAFLTLLFHLLQQVFPIRRPPFKTDKRTFFTLLFLTTVCIIFLFTNWIKFENLNNRLSPFYYIGKKTRIVEQFRSISRFAWPFLLFTPILLVYLYTNAAKALKPLSRLSVLVIILALAAIQIIDTIFFLRKEANLPNLFSAQQLASVPEIPEKEKYAAILPIPLFMVGSEDYNVTIDDHGNFSRWLYQLSYKNKMPMMAVKLSRTPVTFSDQMMDVLLEQKIKDPLWTALPQKPILVTVSRQLMYQDSMAVIEQVGYKDTRPKATAANNAQFAFIKNKALHYLYTKDDVDFYEWQVK